MLDTAILDEQGRYTVHFFFDRADARPGPVSSAHVRMMQPHAGAGYGMHFPLKPGIEVPSSSTRGPRPPAHRGSRAQPAHVVAPMDKNAKVEPPQVGVGDFTFE